VVLAAALGVGMRRMNCCSEHIRVDPRRLARHVGVAAGARRADPGAGPADQPQAGRPADAPGRPAGPVPAPTPARLHDPGPGRRAGDDLVNRQFAVDGPNRLWITDITQHPTEAGKLYCAAVMDAYSRLIIGWSIAEHMRTELVTDALGMAILRRHPETNSTILHSDHGAQYTSWAFGQRLRTAGLLASMGTVGDCYDNAMMESFWNTLQLEVLDTRTWKTREELANAIFEWIECWYNPKRRHSSIGMHSPVTFEALHTPPDEAD
jgi:putative transposase